MSSTYSTDLRIELIGPGEQAGTWNTTTNTNLGTLIEDAISGYISVSVTSASQALTASNGVADQARNATIALTTTTLASFAVYAPPASKQYTIKNTTVYTATIYNSTVLGNTTAAGTGVAIPAGTTVTVFSDGSNVSLSNTYLLSPTLFSPTLSGVPTAATAAPGTNTTQLATTAFVTNVAGSLGTMSSQNANAVAITGGTISGSYALTAANATNAVNLITTGFSIVESGGKLIFRFGGTTIASMDSSGNFIAKANVTAFGTP